MLEEDLEMVELSRRGAVVTVALNRPNRHNALTPKLTKRLTSIFLDLSGQRDIRVVILTGNGPSFCAGADLNHMRAAAGFGYDENLAEAKTLSDLMLAVDQCPKPVIGRINGPAIGGGVGLACCCDFTVGLQGTTFGFSEVRLGLVPAVISPFVLARIGRSNARRLFLSGQRFDANYALQIGLIDELAEDAPALTDMIERISEQLMRAAPGALRDTKELVRRVAGQPAEDVQAYTSQLIAQRRASAEGNEGMTAFLEKRKPSWPDV